jgi:alpha-galactosidase
MSMKRLGVLLAAAILLTAGLTTIMRGPDAQALENGVARTPPMGWNSCR